VTSVGNPGVHAERSVGVLGAEGAANAFIDFMLLPATQQYLADDGFEIPVVEGAEPPEGMPTAAELTVPGLDMREYEELQRARQLLTDVGIIMGPGQR
jgi:iron(III) transport system substrate-binding protein